MILETNYNLLKLKYKSQWDHSKTYLCHPTIMYICKRTMLSRSIYVARAAYHCLKTLTSSSVLEDTTKENKKPLIEAVVNLSIDHQKGIPQHKTTLLKHIVNDQFPLEYYYYIKNLKEWPQILCEPEIKTDLRVLNEIRLVVELLHHYGDSVDQVRVTGDSITGNFPHQKQTNQDFWVTLRTTADRCMGLVRLHDEKSGKGMFTHTTRGTLGLITYDNNTPVPFTTGELALVRYNLDRLTSIESTLTPVLFDEMVPIFKDYTNRLNTLKETDHQKIMLLNNEIQDMLWKSLHSNPSYPRSISFVFTKNMEYEPLSPLEQAFADKFISLLGNKLYSMDKVNDRRIIFRAMLLAYKETIDSQVIQKLEYLEKTLDIDFNKHFLQDVANFIKTAWTSLQ